MRSPESDPPAHSIGLKGPYYLLYQQAPEATGSSGGHLVASRSPVAQMGIDIGRKRVALVVEYGAKCNMNAAHPDCGGMRLEGDHGACRHDTKGS